MSELTHIFRGLSKLLHVLQFDALRPACSKRSLYYQGLPVARIHHLFYFIYVFIYVFIQPTKAYQQIWYTACIF